MKRDDIPLIAELLDMLALWHRIEGGWVPVSGFPPECPYTVGYKVSRQYDSENGADETDARGLHARRIGNLVEGMQEPYRTALRMLARNRATGASVWISPRLPTDDTQRAQLVADAVDMLAALV